MPVVEQAIIIEAPMTMVMAALNDVQTIPEWATVTGVIDNIQGSGPRMTYDWYYNIGNLNFSGKSRVIEQTENTLITQTTGDIASIWIVTLTPASKKSTAMQVVVEYTLPNAFVEVLADAVIQQYATPEVAHENMRRFKEMVEARAKVVEKQIVVKV